ncbi:hypothetical protein F3Y22_tig00008013pilonHSYRG00169 [Hibiscus syriacus]|uniref:J domain-containing protein n=1 Tax=Hibiscus syriacus TaxID=106335 RepID=A0A6A3CBD4_HIBSY|nr:hypothetical protein F3Y22_tig00008013pilonHSYRG00169 [Hibiscus syriacus]
MDCNEDEAIRARDIAEQKMQNKGFSGAPRVASKAQQLCQDLENISQMIVVCDVHCAAEKRLFGDGMDWYAILKVEPTADEATIKKQYRKFALQFHPDKNKFPGAEAAFKPSPAAACRPPQNPSWYPHVAAQNNFCANFPGLNSQQKSQSPTQMDLLTAKIARRPSLPVIQVLFHWEVTCVSQSFPNKELLRIRVLAKLINGLKGVLLPSMFFTAFTPNAVRASEAGTRKVNDKRGRKQTVESCKSSNECDEDIVIEGNGDLMARKKFNSQVEQNAWRSVDHRVQMMRLKKCQMKTSKHESRAGKVKEDKKAMNHREGKNFGANFVKERAEGDVLKKPGKVYADGLKENLNPIVDDSVSDTSFKEIKEPLLFAYPDPEFYDFDNAKKESCFSVGQIWVLYDTLDAKPRFYALIRKIFSSAQSEPILLL